MHNVEDHIDLMIDFVSKKQNPTILEFGVERGSSTKKFIEFAEKNSAMIFSVDITDKILLSHYCNWTNHFNNYKKKDDLADSFLQGIWYLNSVNKLNAKFLNSINN